MKEGWDCPFAYILATLANKSSTVDVEQILGRVLRLPYTHKNSCKFLNLSYVITCSSDFNATISKIVQGLNNAGFSEREYRLANPSAPIEHSSNNDQLEIKETDSELSDTTFDQKKLIDMLHERNENDKSDSLSEMLQSADMSSDTYDKALSEETDGTERYTSTGRNDMPTYRITQRFESEVLSLKIPQFFVARTRNPNLFTIADPTHRDLLTKEELENGFTLKDKDTCIDFDSVSEDVATIDIQENNQPKYLKPNENDSRDYLQMLRRLPPERRIQNCTAIIKNALGKIDNISEGDLLLYIRRVIENMDEAHLIALGNNVYGYANKIKAKIEVLLETYRKKEFKERLDKAEIECNPSFQFHKKVKIGNSQNYLARSLYESEQCVNGFEQQVIEIVASLDNIKWWHRNIERVEFCINGFINHYPDFIVMTNKGTIVMIETKGEHLLTNDGSNDRAELGELWQAHAGKEYRYYMVCEWPSDRNLKAITLDELIRRLKAL